MFNMSIRADRKVYKNDFCDYLVNKTMTLDGIIEFMRKCQFPFEKLPPHIQEDVTNELRWRRLQRELR